MNYRTFLLILFSTHCILFLPSSGHPQSDAKTVATDNLVLVQALMCEDIQDQMPQNSTSVFSIERRKVMCFTSFEPVTDTAVIYHYWFHRDQPSFRLKLTVKPPLWSAYSSIQLRAEDLGPWRVEITDSQGVILQILRFSIAE